MDKKKFLKHLEDRKISLVKRIIAEAGNGTLTEARANSIAGSLTEVERFLSKDYEKMEEVIDNIVDKELK